MAGKVFKRSAIGKIVSRVVLTALRSDLAKKIPIITEIKRTITIVI